MHCGCRQTPRCTGEAETILLHLAASTQTKRRRPSSESLLGGFLRATGGRAWHADGDFYRIGKGKRVSRTYLDGMPMAISIASARASGSAAHISIATSCVSRCRNK